MAGIMEVVVGKEGYGERDDEKKGQGKERGK